MVSGHISICVAIIRDSINSSSVVHSIEMTWGQWTIAIYVRLYVSFRIEWMAQNRPFFRIGSENEKRKILHFTRLYYLFLFARYTQLQWRKSVTTLLKFPFFVVIFHFSLSPSRYRIELLAVFVGSIIFYIKYPQIHNRDAIHKHPFHKIVHIII